MRLDDPITKWAPEFADMRVLRRPDGPLDDTYPAPRPITIEDLMTHRSGLSYGFLASGPLGPALMETMGFGIDSPLTPDQWLKTLAALPLAAGRALQLRPLHRRARPDHRQGGEHQPATGDA